MPKRDPGLLIEDMISAVRKIERYTHEIDQESFYRDEKTIDAVVRNLGDSRGGQPGNY
ncbi:MAG TPA: toxin-antitoxin system antitoxin subunit [Thermoanaerobaculia bacterium]